MKRYVCLEGIEHGNRFYTTNDGSDPTKSAEGETWYKVLGYADTSEEAESILYPTELSRSLALMKHILEMRKNYDV